MIVGLLSTYRDTLQSDRRSLLDHFSLTDIAHKVVGWGASGRWRGSLSWSRGSATTRCCYKLSRPRNLSWRHMRARHSQYVNQGERVVSGNI